MSGQVVRDLRKCDATIARFLEEDGSVPNPPSPAWCLIVDGKHVANFRLGEERALLEAYFRAAREAAA